MSLRGLQVYDMIGLLGPGSTGKLGMVLDIQQHKRCWVYDLDDDAVQPPCHIAIMCWAGFVVGRRVGAGKEVCLENIRSGVIVQAGAGSVDAVCTDPTKAVPEAAWPRPWLPDSTTRPQEIF